jgi:hypothetical protein
LKVRATEPLDDPDSLEVAGDYLTPLDPTLSLDSACWIGFTPPATTFPSTGVSTNAQAFLRFSEPMDPASLSPFENFLIVRGVATPGTSTATPTSLVLGNVTPSRDDLSEFAFTPALPLDHTLNDPVTGTPYHIELSGAKDLAGNTLLNVLPFTNFTIDPLEPTSENGAVVLRFGSNDEYRAAEETGTVVRTDLRGQFFYDLSRGVIKARPVSFRGFPADRTNPIPALMTPVVAGTIQPLTKLGAKLQAVWRHADFGFPVDDETKFNLDVIGLNWAPIGGQILRDSFERFEIILGHSRFLPDERVLAGNPRFPASGLQIAPNVFADNFLTDPLSPPKVVHSRTLGYVINPADAFMASTGTTMLPSPMNRGPGADLTFTWRDTSVLAKGGPNSAGIPMDMEVNGVAPPQHPGPAGVLAPSGQVPTYGLPLLMEFRCFPSDNAIGLNAFDVSLAVPTTTVPGFRVFTAGFISGSGQPVLKNPDAEIAAVAVDTASYVGQIDAVTRVSRVHTVWLDSGLATPDYLDPIVQPTAEEQPAGTQAVLDFRGAIGFSPDAITAGSPFDSTRIDPYGELRTGTTTYLNGQRTWSPSIHQVDGAKYVQVRITFVNNIDTALNAELSALGIPFSD